MLKLWGYECRRLLGAKAFLGMAAVTLWYARQSLLGEIIWGVADTAPFSPWSFGYYLARMTPFLCAAGLLLLTGLYTKPARQTAVLVQAAPMKPWQYAVVRCGAVIVGQGLLSLCVAGMGIAFFLRLFGTVALTGFGEIAVLLLLPLPVLSLGLGTLLGRWGTGPLYGLAALLFFLPSLPGHFDATGLSFFQTYPVTLGVLDPPLPIPSSVWIGRLVMLPVGLGLFAVGAAAKRSRVQ